MSARGLALALDALLERKRGPRLGRRLEWAPADKRAPIDKTGERRRNDVVLLFLAGRPLSCGRALRLTSTRRARRSGGRLMIDCIMAVGGEPPTNQINMAPNWKCRREKSKVDWRGRDERASRARDPSSLSLDGSTSSRGRALEDERAIISPS